MHWTQRCVVPLALAPLYQQISQLQLQETQSSTSKAQELEQDLKEKNLLLGKLRHQSMYDVDGSAPAVADPASQMSSSMNTS